MPPHRTGRHQGIMDHTCCSWPCRNPPPPHLQQSPPPFLSHRTPFLKCPLQETKTNEILKTTAMIDKRFIDRDECGEWWSCLLQIQSPHLSGSTWQHFWAIQLGGRYAGAFYFSRYPNRCIKPSWAKQQTGVSDVRKEKCFCSGGSGFLQRI